MSIISLVEYNVHAPWMCPVGVVRETVPGDDPHSRVSASGMRTERSFHAGSESS